MNNGKIDKKFLKGCRIGNLKVESYVKHRENCRNKIQAEKAFPKKSSCPCFFLIIWILIFSKGGLSYTDRNSALSMLNALIESEAAILAIVITLSLVAVQLTASSYSPRVTEIFRSSKSFKVLISIYIFSILYSLCVLKMVNPMPESYSEAHIKLFSIIEINTFGYLDISFCYFLGGICFTALIPYTFHMLDMLEPSTIIDHLSRRITKANLLKKDEIQPIADLLQIAIVKYDYKTIRESLEKIKVRTCDMWINDEFSESEEEKISKYVYRHFSKIGKLSIDRRNEDLASKIISNIEETGKIATDRNYEKVAKKAILSLEAIGMNAIDEKFEKATWGTAFCLGEIGMTAAERKIDKVALEAVLSLKEITMAAVEKDLGEAWGAISILRKIGIKAVEKELDYVSVETISILRKIGIKAVEKKSEEVVKDTLGSLKLIGLEAVKKRLEGIAQSSILSIDEIEKMINKKSKKIWKNILFFGESQTIEVEKDLIKISQKNLILSLEKNYKKSIKNHLLIIETIGMKAIDKKLKGLANLAISFFETIGMKAIDEKRETAVLEIFMSLKALGITAIEKKRENIAELAIDSLNTIGNTAVKRGRNVEAWKAIWLLKTIGLVAVEEKNHGIRDKVLCLLTNFKRISESRQKINLKLGIKSFVNEIKKYEKTLNK